MPGRRGPRRSLAVLLRGSGGPAPSGARAHLVGQRDVLLGQRLHRHARHVKLFDDIALLRAGSRGGGAMVGRGAGAAACRTLPGSWPWPRYAGALAHSGQPPPSRAPRPWLPWPPAGRASGSGRPPGCPAGKSVRSWLTPVLAADAGRLRWRQADTFPRTLQRARQALPRPNSAAMRAPAPHLLSTVGIVRGHQVQQTIQPPVIGAPRLRHRSSSPCCN